MVKIKNILDWLQLVVQIKRLVQDGIFFQDPIMLSSTARGFD